MENRNFVNLNVNPCKMCMPLGAVLALKGLENSLTVLHGSQGCSTYIRRHMAGHFNEPIDIASSSLSEEGTVYGGSDNLKKALTNVISQYDPKIIGVTTTCLAETIGEDIKRITNEYKEEGVDLPHIIPIPTPGYGGTEFEGYFKALLEIIKNICVKTEDNEYINIILPHISPAEVRNIKEIVAMFTDKFIIYPDISNTLDAPYKIEYNKMPEGGTKISDIKKMSGAKATIELSLTIDENMSPGVYLKETFGVRLIKCKVPVGIRNVDKFIKILSEVCNCEIPEELNVKRGRLLDQMIDSHKHNAEGRAVIYGEPEQCLYITDLCLENGIKPVLISTGSQSKILKELIDEEILSMNLNQVDYMAKVIDETDFETIRKYSKELNANILIGNSDGKFITEKDGIPLLRVGFPIHDRIGGQRIMNVGYEGSSRFLDNITNLLLENKLSVYRESMYNKFYTSKEEIKDEIKEESEEKLVDLDLIKSRKDALKEEIKRKTSTHPCYSEGACNNARMHIPIAPKCNISCNYCNRKYDCVNESRPGVTSEVLTPIEALEKFKEVKMKLPNLKVVGIAGPGDALANFDETKKSLELIKEFDKDITFCLSTNGLMLPNYVDDIVKLGVTHVTITINSIEPEIGEKIYKYIKYNGKMYKGKEAAKILQENQLKGLKELSSKGIMCKVNIVAIKGINDKHIPQVVKKVKEEGAFMTNIMQLIPAKDTVFENMPLVSNKELNELRKECEIDLKQMYHCKQCRADAIGILENDISSQFRNCKTECKSTLEEVKYDENAKVYKVAVASKTGIMVDEHFGHASTFSIYSLVKDKYMFIEEREIDKYCNGQEECDEEGKINKIIKTINDCDAVVVMRIGYNPRKTLEENNKMVIQTCDSIKNSMKMVYEEIENKKNKIDINDNRAVEAK